MRNSKNTGHYYSRKNDDYITFITNITNKHLSLDFYYDTSYIISYCKFIEEASEKFSDEYFQKKLLPFLHPKAEYLDQAKYEDICANILILSTVTDKKNIYISGILKYCPRALWLTRDMCFGLCIQKKSIKNFKLLMNYFSFFMTEDTDVIDKMVDVYSDCIMILSAISDDKKHTEDHSFEFEYFDYILKSISANKSFNKSPKIIKKVFQTSIDKCISLIQKQNNSLNINILKKLFNFQIPVKENIEVLCSYFSYHESNMDEMYNIIKTYVNYDSNLLTWNCLINSLKMNYIKLIEFMLNKYPKYLKNNLSLILIECIPFNCTQVKNFKTLEDLHRNIQEKIDCFLLILKKADRKLIFKEEQDDLLLELNHSMVVFSNNASATVRQSNLIKSFRHAKVWCPIYKIYEEILKYSMDYQGYIGQKILINNYDYCRYMNIKKPVSRYIIKRLKRDISNQKKKTKQNIEIMAYALKKYFSRVYDMPLEINELIFEYVNDV